jgi:hypothetical protein
MAPAIESLNQIFVASGAGEEEEANCLRPHRVREYNGGAPSMRLSSCSRSIWRSTASAFGFGRLWLGRRDIGIYVNTKGPLLNTENLP